MIYIFGIGAIGSNLLLQLIKVFPDIAFMGIDFDIVEERNLRTQAYFMEHMGIPKTQAMYGVIARHIRKFNYTIVNERFTNPTQQLVDALNKDDTLMIDCFDNTESRQLVKDLKNKNILHIGFSPEFAAEIIWNENYEVPGEMESEVDICTLNHAGPFIQYVVSLASMTVIDFIEEGRKDNYIITGKNKVRKL